MCWILQFALCYYSYVLPTYWMCEWQTRKKNVEKINIWLIFDIIWSILTIYTSLFTFHRIRIPSLNPSGPNNTSFIRWRCTFFSLRFCMLMLYHVLWRNKRRIIWSTRGEKLSVDISNDDDVKKKSNKSLKDENMFSMSDLSNNIHNKGFNWWMRTIILLHKIQYNLIKYFTIYPWLFPTILVPTCSITKEPFEMQNGDFCSDSLGELKNKLRREGNRKRKRNPDWNVDVNLNLPQSSPLAIFKVNAY